MRYKCYLKAISLKEALELIENNRTVFYSYSANKPIWALTEGCLSAAIRNDAMFFTQDSMLLGERIMRKDIEWLKAEVEKQDIVMDKGYIYTSDLLYLIDKLDEPEVLSQEWIDENKVARINNLRKMTMSDVVPAEDLQNLIIPKQELPVIPRFVAEWIEHNGENEPSSTIHFTIFYLYANLPDTNSMVERRKPVVNWLDEDGHNYFKLIDAVRYGYEVEEEQKYYVSSRESAGFWFLSKNNDNEVVIGTNKAYYDRKWESLKLTEQEIKDYDSRYWTFAAKVEEVE